MFGISRNVLFAIGGVALAGVLYVGFADDDAVGTDAKADAEKPNKKHKKARSKGGKHRGAGKKAAASKPLCERLSCTEEQKPQVTAALAEFELAALQPKRGLRQAHAAAAAALRAEVLDPEELGDALDEATVHQIALDAAARRAAPMLHTILDEQQRERLAKLVAKSGLSNLLLGTPRPPNQAGAKRKRRRGGKRRAAPALQQPEPAAADPVEVMPSEPSPGPSSRAPSDADAARLRAGEADDDGEDADAPASPVAELP